MIVLFETPSGYAFFKLLDEKKLSKVDDLFNCFKTPEGASKVLKLKHFEKFEDATEALTATTAAIEGKLCKLLKKAIKKVVSKDVQDQLLVADAKLGNVIKEKMDLPCMTNNAVQELMRCIRAQTESLIVDQTAKDSTAMTLGLAHSLSRYKLKFSPDKVDTMIVQAICLLDELDKELNNYVMRCREWYGWHFPELGKIITDNTVFVKTVKLIGTRDNTSDTDLSDILPEEVEAKVKEAAEISMGTEISDEDIINIQHLCNEILEITNYRAQLYEYLKSRMIAIAPNLTILLGELVGARLISHSGSLVNLAKMPASTIQILGAEKALFRALKAHKDTPKYGLIYHSSLVGTASVKNKGKISRSLAAKSALACRVDALGEATVEASTQLGIEHRAKLEYRLRELEEGKLTKISGTAKARAKFEKYQTKSEVFHNYPDMADSTITPGKRKVKEEPLDDFTSAVEPEDETWSGLKQKKKKPKTEDTSEADGAGPSVVEEGTKKKKKKSKVEVSEQMEEEVQEMETEVKKEKKKKKKKQQAE